MTGIITHIYCALALATSGTVPITNERALVAGAVYPSIRVMGILKHEDIGRKNPTWQDLVAASDDFERGIMLHHLVNSARSEHLEKPLEPRIAGLLIKKDELLRFYEDSVLYSQIQNWPKIMGYFDFVLPQERAINQLPDTIINQWHTFLRTYCAQQPSAISSHLIFNQLPQVRSAIPFGLPSLASKAYVAIGFKALKKSPAPSMINRFYEKAIGIISGK